MRAYKRQPIRRSGCSSASNREELTDKQLVGAVYKNTEAYYDSSKKYSSMPSFMSLSSGQSYIMLAMLLDHIAIYIIVS